MLQNEIQDFFFSFELSTLGLLLMQQPCNLSRTGTKLSSTSTVACVAGVERGGMREVRVQSTRREREAQSMPLPPIALRALSSHFALKLSSSLPFLHLPCRLPVLVLCNSKTLLLYFFLFSLCYENKILNTPPHECIFCYIKRCTCACFSLSACSALSCSLVKASTACANSFSNCNSI